MSANSVALAYLVASVFFILALKGLSSPLLARRGNLFGMIGMAIAVITTLTVTKNWALILGCIAVGGTIGTIIARRVQMTAMPELVAFMHSLVGLAAVFIAIAAVNNPHRHDHDATGLFSEQFLSGRRRRYLSNCSCDPRAIRRREELEPS